MTRAVVLTSGGLDSSTCLAMAVEKYGAAETEALNILYGQKNDCELASAKKIAEHYGVRYTLLDLRQIFSFSNSSMLRGSTEEIPEESYAEQLKKLGGEGTVSTYVPFRNGTMLSSAASFALSRGAEVIMYGAHADDAAGRAYPDCTPEFAEYMGKAIYEGSGRVLRLEAPFINMTKADIVRKGLELHVPYELTWSCYEGREKACGVCGTCRDRLRAFKLNGAEDPIEYERFPEDI